jgi:oxygen-dependent protoporphyrinogen oxidase
VNIKFDQPVELLVIGGGIAGLSAAFEAKKRGVSFILVEAQPQLGGIIRTESENGFTIDAGPDAIFTQKPAAIQLCQELGLADRLMSTKLPRTAFVMRNGSLHPLPEASVLGIPTKWAPFAASSLLSPMGKFRMSLDLVIPRNRSSEDESIASFFRRRFGREAVHYLAEPLLAGIHAGNVDRLSVNALFPNLRDAERHHGSVIRAYRKARGNIKTDGPFRSLPGGIGELIDTLIKALPNDNLKCNTSVDSIEHGSSFVARVRSGHNIEARQIILATPAYVTSRLIAPIDQELARLCGEIPYQSTVTVFLSYPRKFVAHPLLGSGFVVPRIEHGSSLMAATWVSSKWKDRAPNDQILIRGFMGGSRAPGAIDREDGELIQSCHEELSTILGISTTPNFVKLYRWVQATAQHEVGHLKRLSKIEKRLERLQGLYLTGSGYRGTGIPDCVADGRNVATKAISALTQQSKMR